METQLDQESAEWIAELRAKGRERDRAVAALHQMLIRVTSREVHRRAPQLRLHGPELDDLAHQAAADAVMSILTKVDGFRGESRFTTWAYKFAILEVSSKIGRHFWRNRAVHLDHEDWNRLPERLRIEAAEPAQQAELRDLVTAIRQAVASDLTARQRRVFVAIVLNEVPLDALVIELGSNRNAIYKNLFDARRKLRTVLVANGYLESEVVRKA